VSAPVSTGERSDARPVLLASAVDALIVGAWFVVAGLVGAVVWWQQTPLPKVVRSGDGATLAPEELVKQVSTDGWFFVVAAVGGLLSGVILLAWRRRDPLLMVVLVVLGAGLASWLMVHVGLALGPDKELSALKGMPDGASVSMQLKLHAPGVAWIWPVGAALGALLHLWVLKKPTPGE
jgi:hypothetical protein